MDEVSVGRGDPIYMAHAYLTKVPIDAITPFILRYTQPQDVVLDVFAGSGMTGVAAITVGRRAQLFDISELGRHIGKNYLNPLPAETYRSVADSVIKEALADAGELYVVPCESCGGDATLSRTIWTSMWQCASCHGEISYYESYRNSGWAKSEMKCPHCLAKFGARLATKVGESPALDVVSCGCSKRQMEQPHTPAARVDLSRWALPDTEIGSHLQMFQASALGRHGQTKVTDFYSDRNLAMLGALKAAIDDRDAAVREKLLFGFTAILTRASKRYQWHPKRPLNAANANYYVAPVFFEWNVLDLYTRKVDAIIKADLEVMARRVSSGFSPDFPPSDARYTVGTAHALPLADSSVDFVFTDPPFGSNIFYSDMNLFLEAWLADVTDPTHEAVVDRSGPAKTRRTADRYQNLLTGALKECSRVLKPGGSICLVFSNSSGTVWRMIQQAVADAGLEVVPEEIATLNKGQRSVKGLASGFENVVTLDLILTLRPTAHSHLPPTPPGSDEVNTYIRELMAGVAAETPSHVYLELVRAGLRRGWDLSALDFSEVTAALIALGFDVDPGSGKLTRTVMHGGRPPSGLPVREHA